jgi:glycosyltransferase involved in cell wall biosynthesis
MVRYLRENGYEPVVLTAPGPAQERWTPVDGALQAEVPADVRIRRITGPEPRSTSGWRHRLERWLRLRDPWTRSWIKRSTELGIAVARDDDVDLIYAWMQPYASAEAAAAIAKALNRPWVADLGDPWALDEMMIYPTALHRRLELRLMRRVLRTAAAIVMSTPEAAGRLRAAFPEFDEKIVVAIPNGFDRSSFPDAPAPKTGRVFTIVHTGYLHTEIGHRQRKTARLRRLLGGAVPGVDILGRSPVFLIEALEKIHRERPDVTSSLEVHFAGVLSSKDAEVVLRSPATRVRGFLTSDESRALICSADLLFLPMHDLPPGNRATVVPGKTYEYVASGRPILAAVPDGDARDLLAAAGTAILCRPTDVDAIAAGIIRAFDEASLGLRPKTPSSALLSRYEYRTLSCELAGVFDRVLNASPREAMVSA